MLVEIKKNIQQDNSIVEILHKHVNLNRDKIVFSYLNFTRTYEINETNLTYEELDKQARNMAIVLQKDVPIGETVILLYPPGLDYVIAFFSCLYAGVIAVPAYPPLTSSMKQRLQAIIADSKSKYILTNSLVYNILKLHMDIESEFGTLHWVTTDTITNNNEGALKDIDIHDETIAFIQYTSGSTANPKGVCVTHYNLLHNLTLIQKSFETTKDQRGVFWLPLYHDMGLIGGMLHNVYVGATTTLFSPIDFLRQPFLWLKIISKTRGTVSGGPNFAYDLCVRKITPDQQKELDLSCWEVAANGAEPIRHETITRFSEKFKPCGFNQEAFYPCYGLAESTLIVSGMGKKTPPAIKAFNKEALEKNVVIHESVGKDNTLLLVSSGTSLHDNRVVIVKPDVKTKCGENEVGEIWVQSKSVAQGYYNRPEESEYTFTAYCADDGDGPFLRTGDLGFLFEGELFITGRLKDMIKIRGKNYYPNDIEQAIEGSHISLHAGCNAAFSIDAEGEEKLVVVQEIKKDYADIDREEICKAIRDSVLMNFKLKIHEVVLIKHGSIQKTSSGKIQRNACRTNYITGTVERI